MTTMTNSLPAARLCEWLLGCVLAAALLLAAGGCADCPQREPPSWDECRGRAHDGDCSLTLDLTIATVTGDASIECEGFGVDIDDPCSGVGWPGLLSASVEDGRFSRTFLPPAFDHGHQLRLEAEMGGAEGGVARLCRTFYTDFHADDFCGEWQCASSGTVVLSEAIGGTTPPTTLRGRIDAVFPGGERVRATF